MNEIIVIGTEPPCPRCQLLSNILTEKVKELGIKAQVRHIAYQSEEAIAFAAQFGLKPGTAKDVAKQRQMPIDAKKISFLIQNNRTEENHPFNKYNNCNWSNELDNFLRPFEQKASQTGILMTPVLIINNQLIHQGSLPSPEEINKWLLDLNRKDV